MIGRTIRTLLLLAALVLWPHLPDVPHDLLTTAILAAEYMIVALSLTLLIGIVGQISLAQAAFVGMGAFLSAIATKLFELPFPFTLLVGLAFGAGMALLIGVVALRVRGLYLAVATMIFAYVADRYLFVQSWLVESQSGTSIGFQEIGERGSIPHFDLADATTFYYVALAVALLTFWGLANIQDSKFGRAFGAIRGSEIAAASLGINVTRYKLLGFALSGALAGLGGTLLLIGSRTIAPQQFEFTDSLYFLSIAVVGGLRSLGGAAASAVLFALLVGEVFFRFPRMADFRDIISAALLMSVLLFFRGGLGAVPERLRRLASRYDKQLSWLRGQLRETFAGAWTSIAFVGRAVRAGGAKLGAVLSPLRPPLAAVARWGRTHLSSLRIRAARKEAAAGDPRSGSLDFVDILTGPASGPASEASSAPEEATSVREKLEAALHEGLIAGEEAPDGRRIPVLLSAQGITVRFGGLTAVDDASIRVGAGEIVGLIGPNGAGKTTLFNSILGLNQPVAGTVHLFGQDVSSWDVHERAALGVGRTFQVLQLFPDLTVFDNLLVATHLQIRSGVFGPLLSTWPARQAEWIARRRVRSVLQLMELEELGDRPVAGLPFGVLRLIEVARTLVTGARLVCFDEPASGLDTSETERLMERFRLLRQIGITLLVIEHDVSMVLRLCDYIYVLDQGRLISEGTATEVRSDPAVVSSYLGSVPAEVA